MEAATSLHQAGVLESHGPRSDCALEWWFFHGSYGEGDSHRDFMASLFRQRLDGAEAADTYGSTLLLAVLDRGAGRHETATWVDEASVCWMSHAVGSAGSLDPLWREVLVQEFSRDGPPPPVQVFADSASFAQGGKLQAVWRDFSIEQNATNFTLKFREPGSSRRVVLQLDAGGTELEVPCNLDDPALASAMHYRCLPRLQLRGNVEDTRVQGQAWFDHQWGGRGWLVSVGTQGPLPLGWDWLGINLHDGSDWIVMRHWRVDATREVLGAHATVRDGAGQVKSTQQVSFHPLRFRQSGPFGVNHPVAWRVMMPEWNAEFVFEPWCDSQEVALPSPLRAVWEGSGRVTGTVQGRAVRGRARGEFYGHGACRSPARLLEELARRVDAHLEMFLPRQLDEAVVRNFAGAPVWRHDVEASTEALSRPVWDLLDRKGKRWRPIFGMLLLEALGVEVEAYEKLICAMAELPHTGSLIIDDIQDASQLRRNEACIHQRYGDAVAINAANTLYFLPVLHIFEHPALSPDQRARIVEVTIRNCISAHFGQGWDIH